jgi:two-component system CheB/CheR fusion protein
MALDIAVVVLSKEGVVTVWNEAAERLWGRREADVVGKALSEIKMGERAGERLLERAATVRVVHDQVAQETFTLGGDHERPRTIRLEIKPLQDARHEIAGYVYLARDITESQEAVAGLRQAEERQREATGKYQAAISELQSTNEELETTNEELQSANEELQTTNEELQSTNEELETINEELQSTNASLDSVNTELGVRTEELNRASLSQRAMLRVLSAAVIGLDSQGQIVIWNPAAEQLLNRTEDQLRNQNLQRLSLAPLPKPLAARIKRALARKATLNIEGFDARMNGRNLKLRCSLIPLSSGETHYGAMLIIEPARNQRSAEARISGEDAHSRARRDGE